MPDEEIDILEALNNTDPDVNNDFEVVDLEMKNTVMDAVEEEPPLNAKQELTRKVGNILADHSYLESDIPIGHEYWNLIGQLRVMK